MLAISIHALREEGDGWAEARAARPAHFYPRPPRGGRRNMLCDLDHSVIISIHALREEGDRLYSAGAADRSCISIHALREEGDSLWRTG